MTAPDLPQGYLTALKTAVVKALQKTFNSTSVAREFRKIRVSIEYPIEKQHYPSIWVNYEDQDTLRVASIDHREFVLDDPDDPTSPMHEVTRWLFSGEITLTVAALSSRERDGLYDEFVRMFAFARVEHDATDLRTLIETNELIVIVVNWDELRPHGDGAAPGTPWNTPDEVIYEKSIGFDVEGEFVSDATGDNSVLVRLAQIIVQGTNQDVAGDDGEFTLSTPRGD